MTAKRTTVRTAIITGLVAPGLLLAPPADAGTLKKRDKRGDAPAGIDIVRYKATNGKKRVIFKVTFRRLNPRSIRTLAGYVYPRKAARSRTYFTFGVARRKGKTGSYFMRHRGKKQKSLKCNEKSKLLGVNTVRISAPQRCFRKFKGRMAFSVGIWNRKGKSDFGKRPRKYIKRG